MEMTKPSFLQTRRHSWVGPLLGFSDDNSKSNSRSFEQEHKKEDNAYYKALNLSTKAKSVGTSSTLEEPKQPCEVQKQNFLCNGQVKKS